MPILDNQLNLQNKIEFDLMVKLQDVTDRLEKVQYALYQTDVPDTRFNQIYDRLSWLEASRKKDQ